MSKQTDELLKSLTPEFYAALRKKRKLSLIFGLVLLGICSCASCSRQVSAQAALFCFPV